MLKTAKVRPLGGTKDTEVLAELVTQFAYLIDEVGHQFEVLEMKNKNLDAKLKTLDARLKKVETNTTS